MNRAGGYKRKRMSREFTMEQALHAVRFHPSGRYEKKTSEIAEYVGVRVSTYLLDILRELDSDGLIKMREEINSRGNVVYMWSRHPAQIRDLFLPF